MVTRAGYVGRQGATAGRVRLCSSRNISPIREARAWRCLFSQGEREFGRAGVLDSTERACEASGSSSEHPEPTSVAGWFANTIFYLYSLFAALYLLLGFVRAPRWVEGGKAEAGPARSGIAQPHPARETGNHDE